MAQIPIADGGDAPKKLKICFIGGGQMCEALLSGLLAKGITDGASVTVSTPGEARRKYLAEKYEVQTTADNKAAVKHHGADAVVVIAVKPQMAEEALREIHPGDDDSESPLFISIMAGVTLDQLGTFGQATRGLTRVVRTMPNTPSLLGCGAAAYVCGKNARKKSEGWEQDDADIVERVMGAVGICARVTKESQMDAVTAVSGSGPAYAYMLIEAMSDGGVKNGLPRDLAMKLAAQTVMGAAKMVIERGQHPAVLKNAVESPGGTTIAATSALEEGGYRASVINAVTAAADRAKALGKL